MKKEGRLEGRLALITGGASGIGRAAALLLAGEGADVVVADLSREAAEATAGTISDSGGKASAHRLDVTDENAWEELSGLLPRGRRLDVLVNSAGVSESQQIAELEMQQWRRVLDVNLNGVFFGTRFAIRAMRSAGEGSIINISSAVANKAIPGGAPYCVSKAGVCMLSRVAALECAQNGWKIRVNSVLPGGVKTPIWRQLGMWDDLVAQLGSEEEVMNSFAQAVPLKRYAEPEEIARAILYLASDDSSYVTGTELVIDGGYTA